MFVAWVIFHVIVAVGLILVVLLQSSKGEGLTGTAFGGGGGGGGIGGAVFGGRGAGSFLSKATTVLAILFMVNCIALAFMSAGGRTNTVAREDITESVVTKQAQAERERALEQQRLQQAADSTGILMGDTSALDRISTSPVAPADTGGQ